MNYISLRGGVQARPPRHHARAMPGAPRSGLKGLIIEVIRHPQRSHPRSRIPLRRLPAHRATRRHSSCRSCRCRRAATHHRCNSLQGTKCRCCTWCMVFCVGPAPPEAQIREAAWIMFCKISLKTQRHAYSQGPQLFTPAFIFNSRSLSVPHSAHTHTDKRSICAVNEEARQAK